MVGRHALGWLIALLLLSLAPRSHAQLAPGSGDAGYDALIRQAVAEYQLGHWVEARSLFLKTHQRSPSARTAMGLGMTEFELRNYVSALGFLRVSRDSVVVPLEPAQRERVETLLRQSELYVAEIRVDVRPSDAALRVDGKPATLDARSKLLLELGRHELSASRPGFQAVIHELDLAVGGQVLDVPLHLARVDAPASPAQTLPGPVQRGPQEPRRRAAAIATLTGGGATMLSAAGLLVAALLRADAADTAGDADSRQAKRLAISADVLGGVGLVLLVTGSTLWFKQVHISKSKASSRVGLTIAPDALQVQLRGEI